MVGFVINPELIPGQLKTLDYRAPVTKGLIEMGGKSDDCLAVNRAVY